jgi:hypothetical protein
MKQARLQLLFRSGILAAPLFAVVAAYFVLDPFKVLFPRSRYYDETRFVLNRDFVSTEHFLRQDPARRYDAFIFGSSRSLAFHCADWQHHLARDVRPFHFDAWSETLFGLWSKVRFLDGRGNALREALLVVDHETLEATSNRHAHAVIKHPAVSGESKVEFHRTFFAAFFARAFFVKYLDWRVFGSYRPYMSNVLEPIRLRHLPDTNDLVFESAEEELARGEDAYYRAHASLFPERRPAESAPVVGASQEAMLEELGQIFRRRGTRVKVIVSPLYDQLRLSNSDRASLERHFGAENVCDFSTVNAWTADKRNYYERSHYRPHVARAALAVAYAVSPGRCASPP